MRQGEIKAIMLAYKCTEVGLGQTLNSPKPVRAIEDRILTIAIGSSFGTWLVGI